MKQQCLHGQIVETTDAYVCAHCGLVLGPIISNSPPKIVNTENITPITELRHDYGIGSTKPTLLTGQNVSPRVQVWFNRVNQQWALNYRERKMIELFCDISKICSHMGLPNIAKQRLCWLARHFVGNIAGMSTPAILADLMFISCRTLGFPRELKEIDDVFKEFYGKEYRPCKRGRISRIYKLAKRFNFTFPTLTAHEYIDRIAWKMGVSHIIPSAHYLVRTRFNYLKGRARVPSSPSACAKLAIKIAVRISKKKTN